MFFPVRTILPVQTKLSRPKIDASCSVRHHRCPYPREADPLKISCGYFDEDEDDDDDDDVVVAAADDHHHFYHFIYSIHIMQ